MKIRIEIDPSAEPEVIIRGPSLTEEILRIQKAVEQGTSKQDELAVHSGNGEYFLSFGEILFFDVSDNAVWAHTGSECFRCPLRLHELQELLPHTFVRFSKSGILNTARIRSLTRGPTGTGEACFPGTEKKAYVSRMYFNMVRDTIEETRLRR